MRRRATCGRSRRPVHRRRDRGRKDRLACYCSDSETDQDGAPAGTRSSSRPSAPDTAGGRGRRRAAAPLDERGMETNCLGMGSIGGGRALPGPSPLVSPIHLGPRLRPAGSRSRLGLGNGKGRVWAYARSSVADDDDDWMGHARVLILLPTVQPRLHFRV